MDNKRCLIIVPLRVAVEFAEIFWALDLLDECAMQADVTQLLGHGHAVSGQAIGSVVISKVLVDEDEEFSRGHVA
jgi:hypothetical protein